VRLELAFILPPQLKLIEVRIMPYFYGVCDLRRVEDWSAVVGHQNWVPTRSAFELAHKWQGCDGFPSRVKAILTAAGEPFAGLSSLYGMVEMPTFLDTLKAPSRTDVMLHCRTQNDEPLVIGVEGKATEPFGDPVNVWVRNCDPEPTPSRSRRLRFLSDLLCVRVCEEATFGYQLVHRTACVVSECILQGAEIGVVLIHSFSELNTQNWDHFRAFTRLLGMSIQDNEKDVLKGPARLGPNQEVAVHFAWVRDQPVEVR
jgi:hypothetical protein